MTLKTLAVTGDVTLNGGTWTHAANTGNSQNQSLDVTIGGDLTIGETASVSVDGKGFSTYTNTKGTYIAGPGAGNTNDGARHGGQGGHGTNDSLETNSCYGSLREPVTLGSAANKASGVQNGGGAVKVVVTGSAKIDGVLSANGNGGTVGASGGSVWLAAASLAGSGRIAAIGGTSTTANKGGGGGGRIAVYAETTSWTGSLSARGGTNTNAKNATGCAGAAGTVYVEAPGDEGVGALILDNTGCTGGKGLNGAAMLSGTTVTAFKSIALKGRGRLGFFAGATVTVPLFATVTGDGTPENALRFLGGGELTSAKRNDTLVVSGYGYEVYGAQRLTGRMALAEDGRLAVAAYNSTAGQFTVDQLKINGTKLSPGTYDVAKLAETYANVSGEGTVVVTGKGGGMVIVVQ